MKQLLLLLFLKLLMKCGDVTKKSHKRRVQGYHISKQTLKLPHTICKGGINRTMS